MRLRAGGREISVLRQITWELQNLAWLNCGILDERHLGDLILRESQGSSSRKIEGGLSPPLQPKHWTITSTQEDILMVTPGHGSTGLEWVGGQISAAQGMERGSYSAC